ELERDVPFRRIARDAAGSDPAFDCRWLLPHTAPDSEHAEGDGHAGGRGGLATPAERRQPYQRGQAADGHDRLERAQGGPVSILRDDGSAERWVRQDCFHRSERACFSLSVLRYRRN